MELFFIIIIGILIYLINSSKKESFVNNTFSHLVELKDNMNPFSDIKSYPKPQLIVKEEIPLELPEKIKNHYFMGRLKLNYYNKNQIHAYLYGMPLETIHNLYSHVVFQVNDKYEIIKTIILPPKEKISHGDSFWVRDENHFAGPFNLV